MSFRFGPRTRSPVFFNIVAGRIANRLDLGGSNFTVDAACASSLAALDVGINQLRNGYANVALVGATDCTNGLVSFMSFAQTYALSPQGRCRPFDNSADGIAISEGVAVILCGLIDRILGARPHATLGIDAPGRPGWLQLAHLLTHLFTLGVPVQFQAWFKGRALKQLSVAEILAEFEPRRIQALSSGGSTVGRL